MHQPKLSLLLSPQVGFTVGVLRAENSEVLSVRKEITNYLLEGPYNLISSVMQKRNHIIIITDSKIIRQSIIA